MPLITIELVPQPYEKKVEIAKVFTDELHRITGVPKEAVTIVFHEFPPESFAPGGELLSEKWKKNQSK